MLDTEYISSDLNLHKTSDGYKLELYKEGSEKAGDVFIYIECQGTKCRLVNRHNVDEGERTVFLSFCTGTNHRCKIRNIPVDNCNCLDNEYVRKSIC